MSRILTFALIWAALSFAYHLGREEGVRQALDYLRAYEASVATREHA